MTSTPTDLVSSPAETSADGFASSRRYHWRTAEEAAQDPGTPDSHLARQGLQSIDQLRALLARRPIGVELAGRVVFWVASSKTAGIPGADRNRLVSDAAALPHLTSRHLEHLVDALDRFSDRFHSAACGLVNHPSATETVAAKVLCFAGGGSGTGTAIECATGRAGHLAATALRLLTTEGGRPRVTPRQTFQSTMAITHELLAELGDRTERYRVVAAVGPAWSGTRRELLDVAAGIAHEN